MKKILIVEDEPDLRAILKLNLELAGYEVCTAADGQEALDKISLEMPDLMVLDVVLPLKNGYEICREVKKEGSETKKIIVILLTARGNPKDKFWGGYCGADEFLTKPFDIDVLLEKIRGFLASSPT